METRTISIHNMTEFTPLLEGIEVSPFMKLNQPIEHPDIPNIDLKDLCVSETLYCSYCNIGFTDQAQQRQHYKLDWHRYNLKQHLQKRKTVSEERFSQLADDVSSISGSESESEMETDPGSTDAEGQSAKEEEDKRLNHLIARKSRILFNNDMGQVLSLPRCLLLNKKEEVTSDEHLVNLVKKIPSRSTWLIVMLGGGHFAAAIFRGGEAVVHKTFHCYTVRAKQGGAQSSKDNKGTHSKSAGASLRRYNEQSLVQHVQELMKSWGPDLVKCDLMFYRAIGRGNANVLFGGSNPPLLKSDPRLRSIPFTTRRPTFSEVKRVYSMLTTVFVYDSNEMFRTNFSPKKVEKNKSEGFKKDENKENKKKGDSPRKIDRAKDRPSPVRELPDIVQQLLNRTSESDEGSYVIECVEEEVSFESLKEFDDSLKEANETVPKEVRKKKPKKKKKVEETEEMTPEQTKFWKSVHGSCEDDDADDLKIALDKSLETLTKDEIHSVLNFRNIEGQTLLHKVASQSKGELVRLLLLHGGDPCVKDKKSLTPYDMCPDKATRNVFRRFMGDFPEMYDYSKSHIPNALTESVEVEIAEKRKAARKAKRQKDRERKQAFEVQRAEEDEKQRFLRLSDREKRALAAERRLLAASGNEKVVLARCYFCAEDITGKVPFEYETFRFCSMPCLKSHRANTKKASIA